MSGARTGLTALVLLAMLAPAAAQHEPDRADWVSEKCARYRKANADVLKRFGKQGLGEAFLEAHQRFLDSNCTARADVCPVSPEEFRVANTLVMAGMNAGMSGTFFPFACRKKE